MRARARPSSGIVDCVVLLDNMLDRDDGIGALGDDAARRDSHRLAGLERPLGRPAGRDPEDDRQRPGRVRRADGEAVHRRARERRQVDARARVLGEHAARGLGERHRLGLERPDAREHQRERLLDREQRRRIASAYANGP